MKAVKFPKKGNAPDEWLAVFETRVGPAKTDQAVLFTFCKIIMVKLNNLFRLGIILTAETPKIAIVDMTISALWPKKSIITT